MFLGLLKEKQTMNTLWLVALASILAAACSGSEAPQEKSITEKPAAVESPPTSGTNQEAGTVVGMVKFSGKAPVPQKFSINKDVEVCGQQIASEELVVSKSGGIQWAVVSVEGMDSAFDFKPERAALDQRGCRFVPRVVVMPVGGKIDIVNSDGILHNFHSFSESNPPVNKAQPKFKKVITEEFGVPELIRIGCDIHSWMRGWIVVARHPWHVVTDADGKFRLNRVPAGIRVLKVWHETLAELYEEVKIEAGKELTVTLELELKK